MPFAKDSKRFFVRGLAILLPSVLTLWLLVYAYRFVDGFIAEPINGWVRSGIVQATPRMQFLQREFAPTDETIQAELALQSGRWPSPSIDSVRRDITRRNVDAWWSARWWTNIVGLVLAIFAVYTAGRLLGGFIGRTIYVRIERIITSIPVLKQVYPSVKQVVDFLFSDDKPIKFNRVVAVEYPRKGMWSMGLVTSELSSSVAPRDADAVTVFMPSSPTPFTGYTITVPRNDVRELPISIDQALRFLVSGGVLVPEGSGDLAAGPAVGAAGSVATISPPARKEYGDATPILSAKAVPSPRA